MATTRTRKGKDLVVCTLCLDEQNEIAATLPGNARLVAHLPGEFPTFDYCTVLITKSQLAKMSAFAPTPPSPTKTETEKPSPQNLNS